MGENTISKIMKSIKESSQEMCPDKRLSNHSVRKTVVMKLKAKEVLKSEIITITAHRKEKKKALKHTILGTKTISENYQTWLMAKKSSLTRQPVEFPFSPLIQSTAAVSSGHVYNFHDCNVVIN